MSDFVASDTLQELWEEILKCHWIYLDSEESLVKLDNRKKLEDCLKEFLYIVQHDRKFFLSETAEILHKTIRDLDGFSAQRAITAFESISQYANNLFTKPWRKEFRILKMYSGFYQHEIKSNLLDAEILFEAMGYRRISEDTLILDGPICPDQVTNVSRDAMIAYVELQIIKHIHTGLDAIGVNCSWLDIYSHREKYTGGTSQAIKSLAYSTDEKRFRPRQKALIGDNYSYIDVQPSSNYFATDTQFCPAQCQCNRYQQVISVPRHRAIARSNGICSVPEHHQQSPGSTATNLFYSNIVYPPNHHQHNQMSHSRSLDHYSEQDRHHNNILFHRHSFDHQQQGCAAHNSYPQHSQQQQQQQCCQHPYQQQQNLYESPYDFIDGSSLDGDSSIISYARNIGAATAVTGGGRSGGGNINCNLNSSSTYSHPYNVSGNRFPLPLNISNQLSAYDNLQSTNYNGSQEPAYARITDQNVYCSDSTLQQNCMMNANGYNESNNIHGLKMPSLVKESLHRQRSCQSEQLINFDDLTILPTASQQQQFDHIPDKHYNISNVVEKSNSTPTPATSACQQHCVSEKHPPNGDTHVYAKPMPKEIRSKPNTTSLRMYPYNSGERGDTTDMSYESANDDGVNLPCQESERKQQSSPTQFTKDQDGVGLIEHWNYVYQTVEKMEKNGCSKDLGDRNDLLIQSLDLDSLNINNDISLSQNSSTEKRKPDNEKKSTTARKPKNKSFDNTKYLPKNNATMESSVGGTASTSYNMQKQKISMDNNTRKTKSALKQTNATSKPTPNHHSNKPQSKPNDNKTANNNNTTDPSINPGNGTIQRKTTSSSSKKSSSVVSTTASPIPSSDIIDTSANEWNCKICTFLNPGSTHICEMCFKTKGFNLDASTTSSSATGAATVTRNTPTCA